MTTENDLDDPQIKTHSIPNLGGILTKGDIYKKGKFDYSQWAKTAQRIRENAPNWYFALEPSPEGGFVWKAPDGTGYLMGFFQNVITGIKLPLYPYAVTVRNNNTVKFNEITANDIQNSHRRCLCACACYSFGDAFELWARVEVKGDEEENAPPVATPGTDRTHTKPNQKLEPVSEQAKKNPPITTEARTLITDQLKELMKTNPDKAKEIAASFIKEFKVPKLTGFITEARHGEFLSHAISKIADD